VKQASSSDGSMKRLGPQIHPFANLRFTAVSACMFCSQQCHALPQVPDEAAVQQLMEATAETRRALLDRVYLHNRCASSRFAALPQAYGSGHSVSGCDTRRTCMRAVAVCCGSLGCCHGSSNIAHRINGS